MKTLIIILSLLFSTCLVYGQEEAKPEEANPDYSTTIANAVKAGGGTLTPAIVNALMTEAGAENEEEMFKAIMAAYPTKVLMIAKAALGSCSDASLVAIAQAAVANTNVPSTEYTNLYNIAVGNNSNASQQLAQIFNVNSGGGGGLGENRGGGLQTIITGQQNNKDEDPSSP